MDLYFAYAARGRTAWWRYILTVVGGLVLAIFALALFSILLARWGLLPRDFVQQLHSPAHPWPFFGAIAVMFGAFGAGLAAAAALIQRKRPGDIIGAWRWQLFLWGLLSWLAVQALLVAIDFAVAPSGFSLAKGAVPLLAFWTLGAVLVQTFAEDFVFRGFITQGIALVLPRPLLAACVSGLVFGAVHIPNGWPQTVNAAWFGIVCAYIAIRTGGIALTSGIHLANNAFGAMGVVSGGDVFKGSPGLLIQNTPQLQWWDLGLAILALAVLPLLLQKLRLFPVEAQA